MTDTLAHGNSSESTQWQLSNEYQQSQGLDGFQKSLFPCPLDKSSPELKGLILSYLYCQKKRLLVKISWSEFFEKNVGRPSPLLSLKYLNLKLNSYGFPMNTNMTAFR